MLREYVKYKNVSVPYGPDAWMYTWILSNGYMGNTPFNPVAAHTQSMIHSYTGFNSVATPGWFGRKITPTVGFSKKKINLTEYLRRPVVPSYKPPVIKLRAKPVRKAELKWSDLKIPLPKGVIAFTERRRKALQVRVDRLNHQRDLLFLKKLRNWEAYIDRRNRILEAYEVSYRKRRELWEKRYTIYQDRLRFVRNWQNKPKRVPHARADVEQDNPYWKTKFVSTQEGNPLFKVSLMSDPVTFPWQRTVLVQRVPASGLFVTMNGLVSGIMSVLEEDRNQMKAKLHSKFYDKLSNQSIHLANMIAERAQTIDLFASSVRRLHDILTGKKQFFKTVFRYVRSPNLIASDILAFKFGIEPLIHDIESSAQLLATKLTVDDEIVLTIRTNTKRQIEKSTSHGKLSGVLEISYVVKYTIDNQFARTLQEFGLINSAEIAWELMPWSFVFDWFLPIGRYLTQLTADVGLTFKTGVLSERFSLVYESKNDFGPPEIKPELDLIWGLPPTSTGHVSGLGGSFVIEHKVRTVLNESPPKLDLYTKSPLSWTHGIEALALVLQRLPFRKGGISITRIP